MAGQRRGARDRCRVALATEASVSEAAPHAGVLTRLGASAVHGVGVFAIHPIAAGTDVFPNDRREIVWVDAALVDALPETSPERGLYVDFGIRRGDLIGCPPSFDMLGTGWYLNQPVPGGAANIGVDEGFEMRALRDIAVGEELTVDYATFSEAAR